MKKNTMLCIDLKTILQVDALLKEGKVYHGDLLMDGEFHACFVEKARKTGNKRNVRIFDGEFITVTYRLKDGHIRFNFKEVKFGSGFNPDTYAIGVCNELRKAISGLVEEISSK